MNARGGVDVPCKKAVYVPVASAGENQRFCIGQGVAAGALDNSLKDLTTEGEGDGHVWLVIA